LEYRIRFADRVYNHFYNEGVFQPETLIEIFMNSATDIELAIIAESAKWGDLTRSKNNAWEPAVDDIVNNFFPDRGDIVLDQLGEAGLYPNLDAPIFETGGNVIETNVLEYTGSIDIVLDNPNGTTGSIFYTLDGSDPRLIGGSIATAAVTAGDGTTLNINSTSKISARVNNGSNWSPLHVIMAINPADLSSLQITEIHYHPLDEGAISGREFEFLELQNPGSVNLDLSFISFTEGIAYTFPANEILEPGEFFVLASDSYYFNQRYGFFPDAVYEGQLDNGGEKVILSDAAGDTIIYIRYNDQIPWPVNADGGGYSLVWTNDTNNNDVNDPLNWSASQNIHGSPGAEDVVAIYNRNGNILPNSYELKQNYPNPFNPITTIRYALKQQENVKLIIYNLLGQEVDILVDEYQNAGWYDIQFDASELASGVYIYQIQAGQFVKSNKMVVIK
jgi:hypothetical protein